jgi:predicted ATP-grasp superfamily ATP-dependent carboligase
MAVAVVLDRGGRLVARFQQVALRTFPASGGPSSLAMSIAPDEVLVDRVAGFLREAGFWGLAHVQFVGPTDDPALIDINTRYYGSLALALAAGVNLPAAWHAVATGAPAGPPEPYRVGVSYRWLEADMTAVLRGASPALLAPARPPRTGSMWSLDDPVSGAILAGSAVMSRVRRRVRGSKPT